MSTILIMVKLFIEVADIKISGASVARNMVICKETMTKPKASDLKISGVLTVRNTVISSREVNKPILAAMYP